MDPNSPPPSNPYGFIMDTQHQAPKKPLQPNNKSLTVRLLVAAGVVFVLAVASIIFIAVLNGSKESNTELLTKLASEQQEVIRVADLGVGGGIDPAVRAFAQTAKLTVQTQQNGLVDYLGKKNVKLEPAALNANKNSKTDDAFKAASASNRFDSVFSDTIRAALTAYAEHIKTNYETASNQTSKDLLNKDYTNTVLLLQ